MQDEMVTHAWHDVARQPYSRKPGRGALEASDRLLVGVGALRPARRTGPRAGVAQSGQKRGEPSITAGGRPPVTVNDRHPEVAEDVGEHLESEVHDAGRVRE